MHIEGVLPFIGFSFLGSIGPQLWDLLKAKKLPRVKSPKAHFVEELLAIGFLELFLFLEAPIVVDVHKVLGIPNKQVPSLYQIKIQP